MTQSHKALAERLIPPVTELRRQALDLESANVETLDRLDPGYRDSAANLLHYLALRQSDIRQLQRDLTSLGLNPLGSIEAYTLNALDAVLVALHRLSGEVWEPDQEPPVNFRTGPMLLNDNARLLLGSPAGKRTVRIMVTMPSEAAMNYPLVRDLLEEGMDVARINCAHDDEDAWQQMIANLRRAEREIGRQCRIYADLAGPKLRTGGISPAGKVVSFRPERDLRGRVTSRARIWLTDEDAMEEAPPGTAAVLPLPSALLQPAQPGDTLTFVDTRDQPRELTIVERHGASLLAESDKTAYVETGLRMQLIRGGEQIGDAAVGPLPDVIAPIPLSMGDQLVLVRADELGSLPERDSNGTLLSPGRIPCTLEEAFDHVRPGERILFDDGKIGGRVVANDGSEITVEITHTGAKGASLRPEKGINLPDSDLGVAALTEKDRSDLAFMAHHADIIGMSFVRTAADVELLQNSLDELGAAMVGIVLKIENNQAFENLPKLLLTGLRRPPFGIMVARGDLAAEVGFDRLAEVQEEILWLCEAAHVPVIWATQVLETLARRGSPSRAEVSDAVMSGRAECVMLNKGPYIVETVRFLSGVLERMGAHFSKQRARLRRLSISANI
jgi:pyruvate kinase